MTPAILRSRREIGTGRVAAALTLNRPEVGNALSLDMVTAFNGAFGEALESDARLIVINGAGRHFCTGFDLSRLDDESDGDLLLRFVRVEQVLNQIETSDVPTLAVAKGRAFGAGADIFVACDRRICLPDASFSFPGPAFGLVLGTRRLAARVGRDLTRDVTLSGRAIGAEEAVRIGLATEIAAEDAVDLIIDQEIEKASRLDKETVRCLRRATHTDDSDVNLAALVRSAARHGLKERLVRYSAERNSGKRAGSN